MKTPSAADAPAGAGAGEPYSHRGLTYPFGRRAPDAGEVIALAPGIGWARLPVPGSLRHVNIWLLDDDQGVAVVDTGLDTPDCRQGWEQLLAGPLADRTITRILCTHFHPDHVGLAGSLTRQFDVKLWMTRSEWLLARMLLLGASPHVPEEAVGYWRAAGWSEDRIAEERQAGWGRFAAAVTPLPASYVRIADGDTLAIGARRWRVVIGSGHSPEHACLVDEENGVLIAGDQVLPRITSNVSLMMTEPDGDPLGDWLASIARLQALPDDLLVLPSHGEPFVGLRARLQALDAGHRDRLEALHRHLEQPRRAVDCFHVLFGRSEFANVMGLATGEALAHLRRLEVEGRAIREVVNATWWFRAC